MNQDDDKEGGEEDEDRPTKNKHDKDEEEEPEVRPKGKRSYQKKLNLYLGQRRGGKKENKRQFFHSRHSTC